MSQDTVKFVRIKGRVIPIRKRAKKPVSDKQIGVSKIAAGTGVSIAGAAYSSGQLKKSFSLFKKSSEMRGISKLASTGSRTQSDFIKKAAKLKVGGKSSMLKARSGFGLALGIGSLVIGSGVSDILGKENDYSDEASNVIGTAVTAGVVGFTAKKFGVKAFNVGDLFTNFSRKGQRLSRARIRKFSKTKFDPSRAKKGTQFRFDI